MLRMTEQQWDAVIAVNLKSAFNFIHACVPVMMRQRGGSIINMSSVVGVHGNAGQANYAASKAFESRSDCFGKEYRTGDGTEGYPCKRHCSRFH